MLTKNGSTTLSRTPVIKLSDYIKNNDYPRKGLNLHNRRCSLRKAIVLNTRPRSGSDSGILRGKTNQDTLQITI